MYNTAYALDMAVTLIDGTMALESECIHPVTITDQGWRILCRVRLYVYRQMLAELGFSSRHIEQFYPMFPSRFTDPAYAKQERKVARVERSIRRNVR